MITLAKGPKRSTIFGLFLWHFCPSVFLGLILLFEALKGRNGSSLLLITAGICFYWGYRRFSHEMRKRQAVYLADDGMIHYAYGFKKNHKSECEKVIMQWEGEQYFFTAIETKKGRIYAGAHHGYKQDEQNALDLAKKLGVNAYFKNEKILWYKATFKKIKDAIKSPKK